MQLEQTISLIRAAHRARCRAIAVRIKIENSVLAYIRTDLGWRADLPEKERAKIAKHAMAIFQGKEEAPDAQTAAMIAGCEVAVKPWDEMAKSSARVMEKLAKELPVWNDFAAEIHGFGALGLGIIIGEAGDLSAYPTHSHLWKRMGVAVMDGIRQGGLRKGAEAEDWIAHGYNPKRRSRLYTIGDSLIKKQNGYRFLYLDRKEIERAKLPDTTAMHIHRRAQRYMEKRLLRDLWRAWRRAAGQVPERAKFILPAAHEHRDAA